MNIVLKNDDQSIRLTQNETSVVLKQVGPRGLPGPEGPPGPAASNLVTSVNGKQGIVVLDSEDVNADPSGSAAQALVDANEYTDEQISNLPPVVAPVTSVFGRSGDILPQAGDYDATDILASPDTNVQQVLNTLDSEKASKLELNMIENELYQDLTEGDQATLASANSFTTGSLLTKENSIAPGTTGEYWRGDKTWQTLDKSTVGLSNVDNTSDASKPISTATQTALNEKVTGPSTSTDNAVARYDGTTGKIIENSSATLTDSGTLQATSMVPSSFFSRSPNGLADMQFVAQAGVTQVKIASQFVDTTAAGTSLANIRYGNNGNGPANVFAKSRSDTIGSWSAVTSGTALGNISFDGDDGTKFTEGARISAAVEGSVSIGSVPTELRFYTTNAGAPNASLAMTIERTGSLNMNTHKIVSVVDPTSAQDAATKNYVDTGLATKQGNISLTTSGSSGVATLVGNTLNIPQYSAGSGTGDVVGPAASTDNAIPRFDGTTGKLLQDGLISIADDGSIVLPDNVTGGDISFGTVNGSRIGVNTSQKIGFFGATPVTRPGSTIDLGTVLSSLGLRTTGSAYTITTSGTATLSGVVLLSGQRRMTTAVITATTTLTTTSVSDNRVTATTAAINITLPATTISGIVFRFYRNDNTAQVVTILGTINGNAAGYVLTGQYKWVELKSTATSGVWEVWGE